MSGQDDQVRARLRLLFVAFHCPPIQGSTGVHRTISFAKHLTQLGWDVTILTAIVAAYPDVATSNATLIPARVTVLRAPALDAQRHLSLFGRHLPCLSRPDRWRTWIPFGTAAGRREILRNRPDVIMSTYPIASAHVIALRLSRDSGIPWVADFRDPLAQDDYPTDEVSRRMYWGLECAIARSASRVTFTTNGAAETFASRYPAYQRHRIHTIANGFDEDLFAAALSARRDAPLVSDRRLTFLHSGVLYPEDRNPDHFFQAIAELRSAGAFSASDVQFVLRASGNEKAYADRIRQLKIDDVVRLLPPVPYDAAVSEMLDSDACLIFQGSSCNLQVPAKLYEYLYASKPIAALVDPAGETAQALRSLGYQSIAKIDDVAAVKNLLLGFVERVRENREFVASRDLVMQFSRRRSAERLHEVLASVVAEARRPADRND